jgi:hypothetical protein
MIRSREIVVWSMWARGGQPERAGPKVARGDRSGRKHSVCLGLRGVRSRTSACPRLMQNGGQWLRLGTSYARSLTLLAASSHAFLRTVLPKSSGWAANLAAAGRRTACAYTVSRCDRLPSLRASRTGAPWHTLYSWHTMLVFSRSIPWGDPTDWMRLVKA